ncbi:MAG: hypothetical protein AVDCRST_MAG68-5326, partial [uncultured Gemmatimonadetes bacterium]
EQDLVRPARCPARPRLGHIGRRAGVLAHLPGALHGQRRGALYQRRRERAGDRGDPPPRHGRLRPGAAAGVRGGRDPAGRRRPHPAQHRGHGPARHRAHLWRAGRPGRLQRLRGAGGAQHRPRLPHTRAHRHAVHPPARRPPLRRSRGRGARRARGAGGGRGAAPQLHPPSRRQPGRGGGLRLRPGAAPL